MNIPEFYSTIAHLFDLEVNKLERIALIELKELSIMNLKILSQLGIEKECSLSF